MWRYALILISVAAALCASAWYYAGALYRPVPSRFMPLPAWSPPPAGDRPPALQPPQVGAAIPDDPFAPVRAAATPAAGTGPLPGSGPRLPVPPLPSRPPLPILQPQPGQSGAASGPQPSPAPVTMRLKLTGVVTGAMNRAILEGGQTAYVAKEGDEVEGWTVVRIDAQGVTLRAGAGQEVTLHIASAPAPATSGPTPTAPREVPQAVKE